MANKLYEESSIQAIADAIREKNGTATTYKVANMADAIKAIQTGIEPVEHTWNQIPTLVKNYLDNAIYDPSDYTVTNIEDYAPSTVDVNNTYPIGVAIETSSGVLDRSGYETSVSDGNVTVYNDIPNKYTEYVVRNNGMVSEVGTIKPTGALRQIKSATNNVRDLGGWSCDGGTVKYGKLFRGGFIVESDRDIFVNQLGIRRELDLRGVDESGGLTVSPWGTEVGYTLVEGTNIVYNITDKTTWKEILTCVFDAVKNNEPLYFHCSAGRDRTGTVACILEAILGVSQSDIDKDYELTCFALKVGTNVDPLRTKISWSGTGGLIPMITALTVGSTFRDKVLNWVATMGFTVDEINTFRTAMIDGTPDTITLDLDCYSVTNALTNVTSDNDATTATQYQPYEAEVSVPTGYVIENITVKMGGVDITNSVFKGSKTNLRRAITKNATNCSIDSRKAVINGQDFIATVTANSGYTLDGGTVIITMGGVDVSTYYSDGKIAIPSVTGDVVITAIAVASAPNYTNLADPTSSDWLTDNRLNSSGTGTSATGLDVSNYIAVTNGDVIRIKGLDMTHASARIAGYNSSKAVLFSASLSATSYATNKTVGADESEFTLAYNGIAFLRVSGGLNSTANDVIITKNEPIE